MESIKLRCVFIDNGDKSVDRLKMIHFQCILFFKVLSGSWHLRSVLKALLSFSYHFFAVSNRICCRDKYARSFSPYYCKTQLTLLKTICSILWTCFSTIVNENIVWPCLSLSQSLCLCFESFFTVEEKPYPCAVFRKVFFI